jgi:hypothetical protein
MPVQQLRATPGFHKVADSIWSSSMLTIICSLPLWLLELKRLWRIQMQGLP